MSYLLFLVVIAEISNYMFVMRYPFATIIITIIVFAFMFWLIFTGELRVFADDSPKPPISIATAQLFCPSDGATVSNIQDLSNEIIALCDDKNACEIDVAKMIGATASTNCALELRVEYNCQTNKLYQAKTKIVHIYLGQIATIKCDANKYEGMNEHTK